MASSVPYHILPFKMKTCKTINDQFQKLLPQAALGKTGGCAQTWHSRTVPSRNDYEAKRENRSFSAKCKVASYPW